MELSEPLVYLCSGDTESGRVALKFRLSYEGAVPSAQSKPGQAKVAMRDSFRDQLSRLWRKTSFLDSATTKSPTDPHKTAITVGPNFSSFKNELAPIGTPSTRLDEAIGEMNNRNGIRFLPLVSEDAGLRCSLDILMLRCDGNLSPVNSGDLDNRVKTIIDALKMPKNANELAHYAQPSDRLFHVLLMDDSLLDGLKVEAGDLLDIPEEEEKNAQWAKLIINVEVSVSRPTGFNLQFLA